jgi:FG-GAP-like repeat
VQATSYINAKTLGFGNARISTLPYAGLAHTFADFKRNGTQQLFMATQVYDVNQPQANAQPGQFNFYNRNADGTYQEDTTLLADRTGCIHPRKAIVADFNQDGRPDIFVACHGYDATPFPGEKSALLMSKSDGTYAKSFMDEAGFNHSATAGDLNGDGYPDLVLTDNTVNYAPYVLINNKNGTFTKRTDLLPSGLKFSLTFSVELVDFNGDGKLDLWIAGHEWGRGGAPTIYLNPGDGNFSAANPTVLPAVPNEGVVLDMVFHNNHIYMLRTSGGDGTFYKSAVVQKVAYPSLSSSVIYNSNRTPFNGQAWLTWVPWMLVVDGKLISTSDVFTAFAVTP